MGKENLFLKKNKKHLILSLKNPMSFGKIAGKALFVVFLLVRGIQHYANPSAYTQNFNEKFNAFHDYHQANPYYNTLPYDIRRQLQPEQINDHMNNFGKYLAYVELMLAACIFIDIPFLPLFAALLLSIETIIFYNPFKGVIDNNTYYCIINFAIIGIALMMSFEPPKSVVRVAEDEPEASSQPSENTSTNQPKKGGKKGKKRD